MMDLRTLFVMIVSISQAFMMPYCGPQPECEEWCPFGYKTDEHGCTICSCSDSVRSVADTEVKCTPPICFFYQPACKTYRKDDNGCNTCECDEPFDSSPSQDKTGVLPESKCVEKSCHYLPVCAIYKRDENGCKTCVCELTIGGIVKFGRSFPKEY